MNIRISNVPEEVTRQDILVLLQKYEEEAALRIVVDRYSLKSLIIVFATIQNEAKALQAIEEMNGMSVKGEIIEVRRAVNEVNV